MRVDLNCDIGEGMQTDELIIPLITSANIACGFHAGDTGTIKQTIQLCIQQQVAIGAHPSWPDKEHFGRKEMQLSSTALYTLIVDQLHIISSAAKEQGANMHHVKPHGALYNQSAKDPLIASVIAKAVKEFDPSLILVGLSGSHSITEAKNAGLKTASEVFADRTYQDDGSLTPRSQPNALIEDKNKALLQVLQMLTQQTVTTATGKIIPIVADSICLHGDGPTAVELCEFLRLSLEQNQILIEKIY